MLSMWSCFVVCIYFIGWGEWKWVVGAPLFYHLRCTENHCSRCQVRAEMSWFHVIVEGFFFNFNICLYDSSSKVEMGKWIEDLNFAIDMARKSQDKSSIFLDPGLGDHSNREFFGYFATVHMAAKLISPHSWRWTLFFCFFPSDNNA